MTVQLATDAPGHALSFEWASGPSGLRVGCACAWSVFEASEREGLRAAVRHYQEVYTTMFEDHSQCEPSAHDRALPLHTPEQTVAADGLLGCNDCGRPAFYCDNDDHYHHVDPEATCYLIDGA